MEERQGWRKFSEMPCFRSTMLTSIISGIVMGLGTFMFTSRPKFASHVGYGTFVGVTIGYWCHCRYKYSVDKFNLRQMQQAVNRERMNRAQSHPNSEPNDKN